MKYEDQATTISLEHFNTVAGNYNESSDGKYVACMYNELVERIIKKKPADLLDIGCGNGNVLKMVKERIDTKLYGIDLSEEMIKEAKKNLGTDVSLIVGEANALPYPDASFDVVLCNASFHHYVYPKQALAEMKRVLRPDGILILGDPTAPFEWYLKLLNKVLRFGNSGDYHIYGKKEITRLLNECGFDVHDYIMLSYRTFILNATLKK